MRHDEDLRSLAPTASQDGTWARRHGAERIAAARSAVPVLRRDVRLELGATKRRTHVVAAGAVRGLFAGAPARINGFGQLQLTGPSGHPIAIPLSLTNIAACVPAMLKARTTAFHAAWRAHPGVAL